MTATYVELSGSTARDLLGGGTACTPLTDHGGEVQLVPSVEVAVPSAEGLRALFAYGTALRATAATGVHDASSRSHALFRLFVQRADKQPGAVGVLTLVDLAGSEQRIDSEKHNARRTKESAAINASLFALKDCVATLAQVRRWKRPRLQVAGRTKLVVRSW